MKIGIDLVRISRIVKIAGAPFSGRTQIQEQKMSDMFTADEMIHCQGKYVSLAGVWAAKEAVSKACSGVPIIYIEIHWDTNNKPFATLDTPENGHVPYIPVSISHDGKYAVAVALVED